MIELTQDQIDRAEQAAALVVEIAKSLSTKERRIVVKLVCRTSIGLLATVDGMVSTSTKVDRPEGARFHSQPFGELTANRNSEDEH